MQKSKLQFLLFALFSLIFALPAYAADLYFSVRAEAVSVDDVFVVEARLSSPDELINVVDGSILFDKEKLEVKELSAGGSVFNLWAQNPSFSNSAGTISFVGGTSDGFLGEGGLILKAIFIAKNKGESKLTFSDNFSLFLSDGKGTKIMPKTQALAVTVKERPPGVPQRDEWGNFIATDTTPPEFIEAIISKDRNVFDGKYFVSFFATDKESGVSRYEIKEGGRDFIRTESPHLLQDQSLKSVIQIKAVDGAGNESIVTPERAPVPIPEIPYKTYLIWILVTLAIIALIFRLWRLWVTKLRKNIQK